MKRNFTILLCLVMMFSVMCVSVFATQESDVDVLAPITATEGTEPIEGEETNNVDDVPPAEEQVGYQIAKVIEAGEVTEELIYETYTAKMQNVKVIIQDGKNVGQEFETIYYISQDYAGMFDAYPLKVGDKVYVSVETQSDPETGASITNAFIAQKIRDMNLLVIGLIIAVVLLILGTTSGLKTLGIVIVNTAVTMAVLFGLYLNGQSAILSLLALIVPIIIADVLIINGLKKESWIVILSVFISTIITIGAFALMNNCLSINGLTEYGSFLTQLDSSLLTFGYLDIIVAGVILMTLGVTIDMGIRSVRKATMGKSFQLTLKEVAKKLPNKLNSVFMVWLGGFITIFVVFILFARPILEIVNVETIIIEIVKVMIVFINAIIVIPIGILLSKELLKQRELKEAQKEDSAE